MTTKLKTNSFAANSSFSHYIVLCLCVRSRVCMRAYVCACACACACVRVTTRCVEQKATSRHTSIRFGTLLGGFHCVWSSRPTWQHLPLVVLFHRLAPGLLSQPEGADTWAGSTLVSLYPAARLPLATPHSHLKHGRINGVTSASLSTRKTPYKGNKCESAD